jgi:hypothetical protein
MGRYDQAKVIKPIDAIMALYSPLGLKLGPPCADNPFKTFIFGEMLDKYEANRLLILKEKLFQPTNLQP